MADRLDEFSFGGAKAKFKEQQMEELRKETESLPADKDEKDVSSTDTIKFFRLAAVSPDAAIIQAYASVENFIFNRLMPLSGVRATNPAVIISHLVNQGQLDKASQTLFGTLREARNAAAHKQPLFDGDEASFYWDSTRRLLAQLTNAAEKLEVAKK